MNTPFDKGAFFVLRAERGYTVDDGGATNHGITQAVYDAFRLRNGLFRQPVLQISMPEVQEIMHDEYWELAHCDDLSENLAIAHFDTAFNAGIDRAIRTLQGVLGVVVDGIYGQKTQQAAQAAFDSVVGAYLDARVAFYQQLARDYPDKYTKYLDGWLNRVAALKRYLEGLS